MTEDDEQQMKLLSVNTGLPREVMWHGRRVTTGVMQEPLHDANSKVVQMARRLELIRALRTEVSGHL